MENEICLQKYLEKFPQDNFVEVPPEIFEKYRNLVPENLLTIWKSLGFGTFGKGFLHLVNPDNYLQALRLWEKPDAADRAHIPSPLGR